MGARLLHQSTTDLPPNTRRFSAPRATIRIVAGRDLIVAQTPEHAVAYDLDGQQVWQVPCGDKTLWAWTEDRFVAHDQDAFMVIGDGKVLAEGSFAGDMVGRVVTFVHGRPELVSVDVEGLAARYSLESGELLGQWDVTEDYDFGRRGLELGGVAAIDDRIFIINGREIIELDHGELNRVVSFGGEHIPPWGGGEWCISADGRFLIEASSSLTRGLVAYDLDSLQVVAQKEGGGFAVRGVTPGAVAWWGSAMTRWAPPNPEVDRRVGGWGEEETSLSTTGEFIASLNSRREVRIWDVATLPTTDVAAEPTWSQSAFEDAHLSLDGRRISLPRAQDDRREYLVLDLESGEEVARHETDVLSTLYVWLDDRRILDAMVGDDGSSAYRVVNLVDGTTEREGDDAILDAGQGWALVGRGRELALIDLETWDDVQKFPRPDRVQELKGTGRRGCVTYYDTDYTRWVHDLTADHRLEGDTLYGEFVAHSDWTDNGDEVHRVRRLGSDEVVAEIHGSANHIVGCRTKPGLLMELWSDDDSERFAWWDGILTRLCDVAPDGEHRGLVWSSDDQHLVVVGPTVRVWSRDDMTTPVAEFEPLSIACDLARMSKDHLFLADPAGNWEVWKIE